MEVDSNNGNGVWKKSFLTEEGISRLIPSFPMAYSKCILRPNLPLSVAVAAPCNCDVEADP